MVERVLPKHAARVRFPYPALPSGKWQNQESQFMYFREEYITESERAEIESALAADEDGTKPLDKEWYRGMVRYLLNKVNVDGYAEYDASFGDNRVCKCGHVYYRHFDTYEDMRPVGCKYCGCDHYEEP